MSDFDNLLCNSDFCLGYVCTKNNGDIEFYNQNLEKVDCIQNIDMEIFEQWRANPSAAYLVCLTNVDSEPSVIIVNEFNSKSVLAYEEHEEKLWILLSA